MRLLAIAWLAVLAGCINAWMLGPTLLFHNRTMENEPDPFTQRGFTEPGRLFSIFRDAPDLYNTPRFFITGDVNVQLPVLALVWALVCGALVWRLATPRSRALGIGLVTVLAGLLALILHPRLIHDLPELLQYIQFPYRILTYVDFCVVGLVTLALAALERDRASARATAALASIAAIGVFNLAISVVQNEEVRSWLSGREEALASSPQVPPSWYAIIQFGDGEAPLMEPTLPQPLNVPVEEGIRDSYRVEYPPGPAGTAQTNIDTGAYLVDVSGAEPVGRAANGQMIVRLPASPGRPRVVVVSAEDGPSVVVSRWISVFALVFCGVGIATTLVVRRRRR